MGIVNMERGEEQGLQKTPQISPKGKNLELQTAKKTPLPLEDWNSEGERGELPTNAPYLFYGKIW